MVEKKSNTCFLCNASTHSTRNNFAIFTTPTSYSDKKLIEILSSVLNITLTEDTVHSVVICKKCYKLCSDIDEVEDKLIELKQGVTQFYEKTLKKQSENIHEEIDLDDKRDAFELPKKPLKKKKKLKRGRPPKSLKNLDNLERTIVTVKFDVPLNDDEEVDEAKDGDILDHQIDSDADDNDSEFYKGQIMEILEEDLQEGEIPLKLEIANDDSLEEEALVKRKRGRPRKKIDENDKPGLTVDMVVSVLGRNVYRCVLCGEDAYKQGPNKIKAHILSEHNINLYLCDLCGCAFLKRNQLYVHIDGHIALDGDGDYQCEVCNRIFTSLKLFRVHKKTHGVIKKPYICDFCGKAFSSRSSMEQHVHTHTGLNPYECSKCNKSFKSKYSFKCHLKNIHTTRQREFECETCKRQFFTKQSLEIHLKSHNPEYKCDDCGKHYSTAKSLETHSIIHTGNKPFVCGLCGKPFARKQEVVDHERTHTGERPFACEICDAKFSQKSNLLSHKRARHFNDRRYPCETCGKAFKRRRLLDYHTKAAHTGERPYKCGLCNASFIYPEHYRKHNRIHTGEKPYLCEVCGKAFNSRDNRNAHRFVHSDKKPYECVICGAGFMRKPLLYLHMTNQSHENPTIIVNQPQLVTTDGISEYISCMNSSQDSHESDLSGVAVEQLIINENGQVEFKPEIESIDITEVEQIDPSNVIEDKNETESGVDLQPDVITDIIGTGVMETDDGPVHLVQIHLPDEDGELHETWLNFVDEDDE